jgi:predicted small lipoprotein YifL
MRCEEGGRRGAVRPASLVGLVSLAMGLCACGQKGALYLPDKPGEVVTRPASEPTPAPPVDSSAPASGPVAPSTTTDESAPKESDAKPK